MYATSLIGSPARQGAGGGTAMHPARAQTRAAAFVGPGPAAAKSRTAESTWRLRHCPEAAADARRITRRTLSAWHIDGDGRDPVLLVVSELVTDAVEHAKGPVRLHLHRTGADGRVRVGVSAGGPAVREGARPRSHIPDEHGRGLVLVATLAEQHGSHDRADGRTIHWARLDTSV